MTHCDHECVCNKYIDHTNTGASVGRECNGETWCFKPCTHDTRKHSNLSPQGCHTCGEEVKYPMCTQCYENNIAISCDKAIVEERKRISGEIGRILREHPARIVSRFFLQELVESIKVLEYSK